MFASSTTGCAISRLHLFVLALVAALAAGACTSLPLAGRTEPTPAPSATAQLPGATEVATAALTPTPVEGTLSPAADCEAGRIEQHQLNADQPQDVIPYSVFLPPCYDDNPDREYPVLILLHGLGNDHNQWATLGLEELANRLIDDGDVVPFLIVMPWQRSGYEEEFEAAVIEALIPAIDDQYRARSGRRWRAIGGISRGGGWAFRIGIRHPDVFSGVGLHSPGILSGDLADIEHWLEEDADSPTPRLWIDIGELDPLVQSTVELVDVLEELDVPHEFHLNEGEHGEFYWAVHLESYLRWYSSDW